jgi:hypothetical protein
VSIPERDADEALAARAAHTARLAHDAPWLGPVTMENYQEVAARLQRVLGHAWFTTVNYAPWLRHCLPKVEAAVRLSGDGVTARPYRDGSGAEIEICTEHWLATITTRPVEEGMVPQDVLPMVYFSHGQVKVCYPQRQGTDGDGRTMLFLIEDHYPSARDASDLAALLEVAARDMEELAGVARVLPEWMADDPEAAARAARAARSIAGSLGTLMRQAAGPLLPAQPGDGTVIPGGTGASNLAQSGSTSEEGRDSHGHE